MTASSSSEEERLPADSEPPTRVERADSGSGSLPSRPGVRASESSRSAEGAGRASREIALGAERERGAEDCTSEEEGCSACTMGEMAHWGSSAPPCAPDIAATSPSTSIEYHGGFAGASSSAAAPPSKRAAGRRATGGGASRGAARVGGGRKAASAIGTSASSASATRVCNSSSMRVARVPDLRRFGLTPIEPTPRAAFSRARRQKAVPFSVAAASSRLLAGEGCQPESQCSLAARKTPSPSGCSMQALELCWTTIGSSSSSCAFRAPSVGESSMRESSGDSHQRRGAAMLRRKRNSKR